MNAFAAILTALFISSSPQGPPRAPVVGSCEGCEAVFDGLPTQLTSAARIAPANEPGEALRIEGTVRDAKGTPVPGVIVYAYHTDAGGIYPRDAHAATPAGARHGRLRAWVKTDAKGHYRFDTIRPAGYPNTNIPQHVHMHVIEPGRATYSLDELLFTDDPRLTEEQRRRQSNGRGGSGIVTPRQDAAGGWLVTRDIVLGQAVPGYPR
jgi:protocatechuate 3,4-dioxygenase beta subunit